jgi:serine protease AprX
MARRSPAGSGRRLAAAAAAVAAVAVAAHVAPAHAALAARPRVAPAGVVSPFHAGTWTGDSGTTMARVRASIGATGAQASTLTGVGVGVALVDTGVVPVPGLPAKQIVNGPDLSFESQAPDLRHLDTYGHGTHLAGIIMGNDPATGFRGVAPGVKLTSVKVGTATGAVDATQVIAAIDWVVAHRNDDPANPIKVLALAYGLPSNLSPGYDPLCFAVRTAAQAGITVVVSSGNVPSVPSMSSPAVDDYIIAVGSVGTNGTDSPADDRTSSFTATGTPDGLRKINLLAPGESIISLRNPNSYADVTFPSARVGSAQFRGSGTSQATAVVAGAAALLLERHPTLTPLQVRAALGVTGTPVSNAPSTRIKQINVEKALAFGPSNVSSTVSASYGSGSLDGARGGVNVGDGTVKLTGDRSVLGPFSATSWAAASKAGTAWKGGVWMGHRLAGDGWTGTSWAPRTWAPATWTGTNWAGQPWYDSGWSGRYWSNGAWNGRYWSAGAWNGRYWSGDTWASTAWR